MNERPFSPDNKRPAERPAPPTPVAESQRRKPWVELKYMSFHPHIYPAMVRKVSLGAKPGDLVTVYGKDGQIFGFGLFNPHARVPLRIHAHTTEQASEEWFDQRVDDAASLRKDYLKLDEQTDAYRVVHADGDSLGGLVVDRYADVLSVEVTSLGVLQRLPRWLPRLHTALGTKREIVRVDPKIARIEAIDPRDIPTPAAMRPVKIKEHGVTFEVDFAEGHKTGFFCDQRDNRLKLANLAKGKRMLELCTYTGGFSIYAKMKGAEEVTAVDLDEKAIAMAKRNANLNNAKVNFVHADAFTYARQMIKNGEKWDVILLDPPKFVDDREFQEEGLKKYNDLNVLGLQLAKPGALFVTCSCSGLVSPEQFEELVVKAAHRYNKRLQIIDRTGAGGDHPAMSNYPESRYLKVLWARVW